MHNRTAAEYKRLATKYPHRVAIIVTTKPPLEPLKQNKFLVPVDMTLGHFVVTLRSKISGLAPESALFVLVKNKMPPMSTLVQTLHQEYAAEDGFIELVLMQESTFGHYKLL